jgi:hypothetical protein
MPAASATAKMSLELDLQNLVWYKVGPWEGCIRCIGTGPGEPRKGPWISEVPHGLSHWRFILICSLFFWYFQFKSTIFREVSACPQAPKQFCSVLQYFFWRPYHHNSFFTTYNKMNFVNPVLYLSIDTILCVLLNMPAASATAKMSFSVLRRLKTCVSSAMKNGKLSSLGLMHIHRDFEVN